jgi:hypothetical protein
MIQKPPCMGYGICVCCWLDWQFPDHWIGRRGPMDVSPISPDFTAIDVSLLGTFEDQGLTGENTKFGSPKVKHLRCLCEYFYCYVYVFLLYV